MDTNKDTHNIHVNNVNQDRKYGWYLFIPTRFIFVFLSFIGFCLLFSYKTLLSVALVAMIGQSTNNSDSGTECRAENGNISSSARALRGDFDWNGDQQAQLLGAFFYGYTITQLPGGVLAKRYGAKWILGISILLTAILALVGPLAARLGFLPFFATRVGQGLFEGLVFPGMFAMFARWLPKMERSIGSSIVITGGQIGTVITLPLAGYLCNGTFMGGWPAIFYLSGIVGCVWFVLWALLIYETPESHPYISSRELEYIITGQGIEKVSQNPKIPWFDLFKSVPMWALIVAHFGNNWGMYTVLTLLPSYFHNILLLDIQKNGLLSSVPWLLSAVMSWIAGIVSDKVRSSGRVSITYIRKTCNSIGFIGPAVCLVAVILFKCNTTMSITFFSIALGLNGIVYSGFLCTHVDMSPDFAGTMMGITNTIASLPGFLSPIVANTLTKQSHTLANWSYVFYLTAGIYLVTSLIFIIFGSAELQSWAFGKRSNFTNKRNSNIEKNDNTRDEGSEVDRKPSNYYRIE